MDVELLSRWGLSSGRSRSLARARQIKCGLVGFFSSWLCADGRHGPWQVSSRQAVSCIGHGTARAHSTAASACRCYIEWRRTLLHIVQGCALPRCCPVRCPVRCASLRLAPASATPGGLAAAAAG